MLRCISLLLTFALPILCDAGVPVIYSTDLYHPHDDPDDHYDLVTLFALPELDVRGIIIDMSNMGEIRGHQKAGKQPGIVALKQIFQLSGRTAPVALGLDQPFQSTEDTALEQSKSAQGGVQLILSTLRKSSEKVSIFTVGSLRDVAAAYNRAPQLMRSKVEAIYINAGTGPDGYQTEWNVRLDPLAYQRVLLSDLPIRWYPCFGRNGYRTYFRVDQTEVVKDSTAPLKAFFDYALTRSQEDPIAYLQRACAAPAGPRNMWCTPSFIDLAGRKIYQTHNGYEALAAPPTSATTPVRCYDMQPVALRESSSPEPPLPAAGGVSGRYLGNSQDRVGKTSLEPDGTPDCLVRIDGLPNDRKIRSAKLSGPRDGIWLSQQNPQRWLLKTDQKDDHLLVSFTYWAEGTHRLELTFDDETQRSIEFPVPPPNSPLFAARMGSEPSNVYVIRQHESDYTRVMTSCLKNLLDSFPIVATTASQ